MDNFKNIVYKNSSPHLFAPSLLLPPSHYSSPLLSKIPTPLKCWQSICQFCNATKVYGWRWSYTIKWAACSFVNSSFNTIYSNSNCWIYNKSKLKVIVEVWADWKIYDENKIKAVVKDRLDFSFLKASNLIARKQSDNYFYMNHINLYVSINYNYISFFNWHMEA